jgi:hypothetical protein
VSSVTDGIPPGRVLFGVTTNAKEPRDMRITDLTVLIEQGTMLTGPVRPRTTADQARIRRAVRTRPHLAG